jgi:dTDP-4-amino-4,6-dideoxygalactose transaminase
VALPGYGCYDLATAAEGAGVQVALYDVDERTLGPDWSSLEALRPLQPAAVVVAHWFGHVADVPAAGTIHPHAVLIEDSAQGVGGSLRGRPLGSFGSVSVLSFGRGKGTTGGAGGALLAHDDRGADIVTWARGQLGPAPRGLGALGALAGQWLLGRPSLYAIPASLPFLHLGETIYHPPRPPTQASPASLGVLQSIWPEAEREVGRRQDHARRLLDTLRASAWLAPFMTPEGGVPGHLRLPARATDDGRLAAKLRDGAALGIAGGYPRPLDSLPSLQSRLAARPQLPGATALAARLVTLPTHRFLGERDLSRLEARMK